MVSQVVSQGPRKTKGLACTYTLTLFFTGAAGRKPHHIFCPLTHTEKKAQKGYFVARFCSNQAAPVQLFLLAGSVVPGLAGQPHKSHLFNVLLVATVWPREARATLAPVRRRRRKSRCSFGARQVHGCLSVFQDAQDQDDPPSAPHARRAIHQDQGPHSGCLPRCTLESLSGLREPAASKPVSRASAGHLAPGLSAPGFRFRFHFLG